MSKQATALSKTMMGIGIALIAKTFLIMWPSIGTTVVWGAIFAAVLILAFRVVKITPSFEGCKSWFIPLGAGVFLNWLVVLANGGFMPVGCQDIPEGIYIPMAGSSLPYFGDWIFGVISPGDIILFAAFIGVIATMVANRRQKVAKEARDRSSPIEETQAEPTQETPREPAQPERMQ